MLKDDMKDIAKYVLKKSYRESIQHTIRESSVEKVNQLEENFSNKVHIIRRLNSHVGTFSDYIVFLKAIEFSIEQNAIPVIDRKTVKNVFLPGDEKVNTWEIFFEQPCGMGLEDIDYSTSQVSIYNSGANLYPVTLLHCSEDNTISYWRGIAKKYIRFDHKIKEHIDFEYRSLLYGKRCLGISIREGYQKLIDMGSGVIWGHPVQASTEELVRIAEEKMVEWNLECVFFTCQTSETVQMFKQAFGCNAICIDRNRPKYSDLIEGKNLKTRSYESALQNEKDYITEIALLSKCNSMICSHNSGSDAAFIMSEGFEHIICLENGVYK